MASSKSASAANRRSIKARRCWCWFFSLHSKVVPEPFRSASSAQLLATVGRDLNACEAATVMYPATNAPGTPLNLFTWAEKSAGTLVTWQKILAAMALDAPPPVAIDTNFACETARGEVVAGSNLTAFARAGAHARQYWFAFNSQQHRREHAQVHPATGQIADLHPAGLFKRGQRVRSQFLPVHSGYVGGWPGALLIRPSGLSLVLFFISGIVTWWRGGRLRRSKGTR